MGRGEGREGKEVAEQRVEVRFLMLLSSTGSLTSHSPPSHPPLLHPLIPYLQGK